MTTPLRCPCGSGDTYDDCCRPRHSGTVPAPTATALMRSRFSAFARSDAAYLLASWHRSTRPARLDLDERTTWTRLEIVDAAGGGPFDGSGVVEFRAHYRRSGERGVLHERSSFVRSAGKWFYVSGEVYPSARTTIGWTRPPAGR